MEKNIPAGTNFGENRDKALEFIRCHIAENCGKRGFNITHAANGFGIHSKTFTKWTNEAIKKWEQEHSCQPMAPNQGTGAWGMAASAALPYVGAFFGHAPNAIPHQKVLGAQKPQTVPKQNCTDHKLKPHIC